MYMCAHAAFTSRGYYSRVATIRGWPLFEGGHYSRVATIRGWPLFEGGHYSRVATIQGWPLFEGGDYSRVASIQGWHLFEGGVYSRVASIRRNTVDCPNSMCCMQLVYVYVCYHGNKCISVFAVCSFTNCYGIVERHSVCVLYWVFDWM